MLCGSRIASLNIDNTRRENTGIYKTAVDHKSEMQEFRPMTDNRRKLIKDERQLTEAKLRKAR